MPFGRSFFLKWRYSISSLRLPDDGSHGFKLSLLAMNRNALSKFFRVGESISVSGIYRVFHSGHRLSHEVVLLSGESFPRCSACGDDVRFELLEAAPQIDTDQTFRELRSRKVFELPHPTK